VSSPTPRAPAPTGPDPALTELVTGVVAASGFVLDDLDVRPAGRRRVVRVVVDTDEVPGPDDGPAPGVDLDAVAALSRELSAALDAEDAGVPADEYTLEVTTPGVDRPLTLARHWRQAWLRRVVVTLADGSEVTGRVGPVTEEESVTLAVGPPPGAKGAKGGFTLRALALGDVARAALDVEFKPAPEAEVEALRAARGGTDTSDTTDTTDTTGKDHS
jgi:ribosome maturation factor RimP